MREVLIEDFKQLTERNIPWNELRDKTFLITGATGLVGSLLVRCLLYANETINLNAKVYAVVRNTDKADRIFEDEKTDALSYIVADLATEKVCCEGECDYIIHAAAVTASKLMVSDPVGTIRTSIDGTEKMLQLAVEKKVRAFIYISSMEIYGQPKTEGRTAEKDLGYVDIATVRSCYPEGKRMCECMCTAYAAQYGVISDGLIAVGVNEVLRSLLVDGIIAGVGGILTFLPNIFILFLALAFLEDSGYMARVAYVMEGIMSKLGLSGRAFIPMILGFGCTVPAIMASRSLENRRDRFKVMLITPFMSCSARLPIYILFAEMFFQERAMLVAYSMYLIGLVVAILVAAIIHLIDRRKSENYLLIELPEYKAPSARTVAIYVWEKVKDYLTKAGTTIFVASILMWVILNFGPHGYTMEMADSFGSILGHWLVPIFAPIGLGFWQIAVALIAGISAKEVVVSSCAVLFGIPNINSGAGMDTLVGILSAAGFGQLNAFCLMIFCLLYVPCAAALATIRKESGSTRWMLFSALFQLVVAWAVTFVVYRVGLLL